MPPACPSVLCEVVEEFIKIFKIFIFFILFLGVAVQGGTSEMSGQWCMSKFSCALLENPKISLLKNPPFPVSVAHCSSWSKRS